MNRRSGRAYIFVRWSGFSSAPGRLGEVGWAFEVVDRLGRFICFQCGALGTLKTTWTERCSTLPELIKAMATDGADRSGYDEAKVFEVESADPELALQAVPSAAWTNPAGWWIRWRKRARFSCATEPED